jgi:hypothetical protein
MEESIGRKFGRWTVIAPAENKHKERHWLCECDCGTVKDVKEYNMQRGASKSCGCFGIEQTKKANTKHGHSRNGFRTRTFSIWCLMRQRCNDTNNPAYSDYGGRGVSVCKRWDEFETFLIDMGECPPKMTIERINNDGNYEPGNVRWATRKEQCSNRRSNDWVEYNGERKTVTQWAESLGIGVATLRYRLRIANWEIGETLGTIVKFGNNQTTIIKERLMANP